MSPTTRRDVKSPFDLLSDEAAGLLGDGGVPDWREPMLATLVDEPFSDPEWIFERKLDGVRCLAYRDGSDPGLFSRNERNLNDTYPELVAPLAEAGPECFVVDGEIVAFDGSVTSFQRLQGRMQIRDREQALRSPVRVFYYLFDVLHLDGKDTTALGLRDRKRLLKHAFSFRDPIRFTTHRNERGEEFLEEACGRGWEGLIAKDARARYQGGRSRAWLKLKCVRRQEFVIGGYTDPRGERVGFGAILIGYYDERKLRYAGKVGTGFDDATLERLGRRMESLERAAPSFDDEASLPTRGAHWIEPELVADVEFTEWTGRGRLRHPRFVGLRGDKDPADVVKEQPA